MRRAAKKDSNHNEVKAYLEAAGAYVHDTHQLKNAFDCIVVAGREVFICEIKSKGGRLTEGESRCKADLERAGGTYWILRNPAEALRMIGKNDHYIRNRLTMNGVPPDIIEKYMT